MRRNLTHSHHRTIAGQDHAGPRATVGDRSKPVINGGGKDETARELSDPRAGRGEAKDLAAGRPEVAEGLERGLRA